MTPWSEFYADTLPELPGLPTAMLDHWLRQVAIEFCERSRALVVTLAAVDAVAATMSYGLAAPAETAVAELVGVEFDDEPLDPKSPGELRARYGAWRQQVGTPMFYTQRSPDAVLLVPAPADDLAAAIVCEVALKPSEAAAGIDDWVFARWRQDLAAGAKAKLMAMTDNPWSRQGAVVETYAAQFEAAIAAAKPAANAGFVRTRPRFAGSFC